MITTSIKAKALINVVGLKANNAKTEYVYIWCGYLPFCSGSRRNCYNMEYVELNKPPCLAINAGIADNIYHVPKRNLNDIILKL